jgi:hypothetical protein
VSNRIGKRFVFNRGRAENGAMVMRDRPQALFRLSQHPSETAVEILSVLEVGPKKLVRKAG